MPGVTGRANGRARRAPDVDLQLGAGLCALDGDVGHPDAALQGRREGAAGDNPAAGHWVALPGDPRSGLDDVGEIRLACLGQRRGDANNDGVDLGKAGGVGGGLETSGAYQFGHPLGGDVADIAFPHPELLDLFRVDVEADHGIAATGKGLGQR